MSKDIFLTFDRPGKDIPYTKEEYIEWTKQYICDVHGNNVSIEETEFIQYMKKITNIIDGENADLFIGTCIHIYNNKSKDQIIEDIQRAEIINADDLHLFYIPYDEMLSTKQFQLIKYVREVTKRPLKYDEKANMYFYSKTKDE